MKNEQRIGECVAKLPFEALREADFVVFDYQDGDYQIVKDRCGSHDSARVGELVNIRELVTRLRAGTPCMKVLWLRDPMVEEDRSVFYRVRKRDSPGRHEERGRRGERCGNKSRTRYG